MRCFVISLAIVAGFTSAAMADIPPPPPERGFKRVPYENVLILKQEMPEYKFFPFQRLGIGGKETLGSELKVGTKTAIAVPSSSSPSVRTGVVAVPKKVLEELKSEENLAKLLYRDYKGKVPEGVVVYETFGSVSDLKNSDRRTKVENVITVSKDEKAGVKFSAKETPEPPGKNSDGKTTSRSSLGNIIAGLSLTLAMVTLAFWAVRRKQPSTAAGGTGDQIREAS
jgi:hypothetical protein